MTSQRSDVLIVGAGPVGLSLALALTRLSLRVRIIDKAPETKREPRAAVIWPRCAEILDDLGLIESVEHAAYKLHAATIYANGRRLGTLDVGHIQSAYPHPLVIEQHVTERLLAGHLESLGVPIEFRTEATDVRLFEDRVDIALQHAGGTEELATSAWVVGCEGSGSLVRQKVGIAFAGDRRPNLQVVQINAVPTWRYANIPTQGYFFLAPNASLGCFPRPGGGYRFFAFTTDPDPNRKTPPTLADMRDLIATVAHAPELQLTPTEPAWTNRARFHDRIATTLRHGRALLAGDAAHVWAPIGGHGMNTGIRGAHNLAWKLAAVHRGEAQPRLLDTYSHEQRAAAQAVIDEMRFNVFERPNPPALLPLLQALLPLGLASGSIRRKVELTLSDLAMHHRGSALSWQRVAARRLCAGDRVPDVAVIADDKATRLHQLLSMQHWTLLLHTTGQDSAAIRQAQAIAAAYRAAIRVVPVAPADPEVKRMLGPDEMIILVRPDRHIGLMARTDDMRALRDYLDTFLVRRRLPPDKRNRTTNAMLQHDT